MIIREGRLTFDFDDTWDIVINYDEKIISDYAKHFLNDKVSAVDFIASRTNASGANQIVFFEVKDLRGHETKAENIVKLSNNAENLTSTIAKNVRDTFYGIVIGNRKTESTNHQEWIKLLNILKNAENQILVILWLEANLSVLPVLPTYHSILQVLKRKLNNLTNLVNVSNIANNQMSNINVISD